ncbi:MAG: Mth938-like domain-containing protein [Gammaproteobacteria bacterium]|nr:Mth938-like domain-containing protein [Gammaproteobacteria bacterium]
MKIHLTVADDINLIKSVSSRGIVIGDRTFSASLLVTPAEVRPNWSPQSLDDLNDTDFIPIIECAPEVVILGTGSRLGFPAVSVTAPLIDRAIGFEIMDTRAACRTFNILASEGRKVVAALLKIGEQDV